MGRYLLDDINHYDWLFRQFGYDISYMAERSGQTEQFDLEMLNQLLDEELRLDARHQQQFWLWIDGAAEAIGMMEADGYRLDNHGRISKGSYHNAYKKRERDAFVSKVKQNVDRVKNHLREAPLTFSAVPNNPEQADLIANFNEYVDEIKNRNNFSSHYDNFIDDGVTYGSGVMFNARVRSNQMSDLQRYHEKIRQGQALNYQEFVNYDKHIHNHSIHHINTFEIIRHRKVSGKDSTDLRNHPWMHRVKQRRISELRIEYPHVADLIFPGTDPVWRTSNPYSMLYDENDDTTTWYRHYINFPVAYTIDIPVKVGGEVFYRRERVVRTAVGWIDRVYGVGVVDAKIDVYNHGLIPLDYWVHMPSSKHAAGIGLVKYGRDPMRIYTIMLNGKLRYFKRMVKGGGFFLGDILDQKTINARTREHEWVKIDIDRLPANLRDRNIGDLIQDNRPGSFPQVYDNLLLNAERAIDEAMATPDASKGIKQGSSGRQEAILTSQAQLVMNTGVAALERAMQPMGEKLHNNIIQFDGEQYFTVKRVDPLTNEVYEIEFNKVIDESLEFDPLTNEYYLNPIYVKNNIADLELSTQISTRTVIPSNPAEKRQFMQDLLTNMYPYVQGNKKDLIYMKHMNQIGFGGIPHFDDMINKLLEAQDEMDQQQMAAMQSEQKQEQQREQHRHQEKATELSLDHMRLNQKFLTDYLKAQAQLQKGNEEPMNALKRKEPQQVEQLTNQLLS